jgi:hypothetical protein
MNCSVAEIVVVLSLWKGANAWEMHAIWTTCVLMSLFCGSGREARPLLLLLCPLEPQKQFLFLSFLPSLHVRTPAATLVVVAVAVD